MEQNKILSSLLCFLLIVMYLSTFSAIPAEAREHHSKRSRAHKYKKHRHDHHSAPPAITFPHNQNSTTNFNVFDFGAKGDGVSDDSKALMEAWKAACKVEGGVVQIPIKFKFLVKPITLKGPCMPHMVFQIDGNLLAPPNVGAWPKSSLFQWINFKWIQNFTIQGTGTVDGQGSNWWTTDSPFTDQKTSRHNIPDMKPTALRFYASYNVKIRDISIINSPLCHIKFDNSGGVKISNITISSPENSPNTDGIHLQNTNGVEIHHSNIGCGDDCVSIQTGCSNVNIHDINCGPGHGISLGGLGKDRSIACVSDIMVANIFMQNTLYGVRIKTWQGGVGLVKNITFSHIQVSDVKVPITIDQFYCDKHICKNQTDAVAISGLKLNQIIGTFSVQPFHLACSSSIPCIDVDVNNVQLKPSSTKLGIGGGYQHEGLCYNTYGKSEGPLVPSSIDHCLKKSNGGSVLQRIAKSRNEHVC